MSQTLKPKKKVWTPPSKGEHKKKVASMGALAGLAKYVGTNTKPKARRSKQPTGEVYEMYAQGKTPNPNFMWQSKHGMVEISKLPNDHLVGIIGYLYWGNAKHKWLVSTDKEIEYVQREMKYTGQYVRDAFDAVVVELVKERKLFLEKEQVQRLSKIVKHIVVLRTQVKKREAKLSKTVKS